MIHAFEGLSVGTHKTEVYSTVKRSHLIKFISPLSSHDVTDRISQECVLVSIASIAIIDNIIDKTLLIPEGKFTAIKQIKKTL